MFEVEAGLFGVGEGLFGAQACRGPDVLPESAREPGFEFPDSGFRAAGSVAGVGQVSA